MKNRAAHKSAILFAGPILATVASTLLVLATILFYVVIPIVVRTLILKETRLLNGTETWEKWTDVKIPILIKFYIFNVTNVKDANAGAKFSLQEVGPYVWEEKRTKQIISVDEDEDTVTYKEVVHYYFRRDLSVGNQDDTLNIVNVPFLAATVLIYKTLYSSLADYIIDFFVSMEEKFVLENTVVRELIFDGVEMSIIYGTLADIGIVDMPDEFTEGTFAFYNKRNGTPTNEYKIYRGIKNSNDFGKISEYDNQKEVTWWTNHSLPMDAEQYCNKINGTDGSLVAPFVTKDRELQLFSHEICRSVYAQFDREINFKGIPAYRFTLPAKLLASPYSNEDNRCFCTDPGSGLSNSCDGGGAIRIFACKKGIPIGLSLPHFLNATQLLHDRVDGMTPDKNKHETDIIVEPNSGAILRIVKRIQISMEFQRLQGISVFTNISEAIIPIFWAEERADPDEKDLAEIRDRLVVPLAIISILKPIVLGFLALSVVTGGLMSAFYRIDKPRKKLLLR